MKLRRRLIPVSISAVALVLSSTPAVFHFQAESDWLKWTLLVVVILFTFEAGLFAWMRKTIRRPGSKLTIFGIALLDFFSAIVTSGASLAVVYITAYLYLGNGTVTPSTPFWLKVVERSCLISSSVWVVTTGIAVGYEMHRAQGTVEVHELEQYKREEVLST